MVEGAHQFLDAFSWAGAVSEFHLVPKGPFPSRSFGQPPQENRVKVLLLQPLQGQRLRVENHLSRLQVPPVRSVGPGQACGRSQLYKATAASFDLPPKKRGGGGWPLGLHPWKTGVCFKLIFTPLENWRLFQRRWFTQPCLTVTHDLCQRRTGHTVSRKVSLESFFRHNKPGSYAISTLDNP